MKSFLSLFKSDKKKKKSVIEFDKRHLTSKTYFESLLTSNSRVVIDFNAPWCKPCVQMKPIYIKLSQSSDHSEIKFVSVNVDDCREIADLYPEETQLLPAFLFVFNGKLVIQQSGNSTSKLEQNLKSLAEM